MKNGLLSLLSCLMLAACGTDVPSGREQMQPKETTANRDMPGYDTYLEKVADCRHRLKRDNTQGAAACLFSAMDTAVAAYWTGTPWDFNGTTRIPRQGSIACGYFVTNVLTDLGFKIRRIKLAQEASSVMIRELTVNTERLASVKALQAYLDKQESRGVFIVGLDFHTGFIIKSGDRYYFLHANYIDREGVVREPLAGSAALQQSRSFMIGSLTANKNLLAQWLRS